MVYVAFVIDVYSRRILGWRAATSMSTALVMAIWARGRDGTTDLTGLIHPTIRLQMHVDRLHRSPRRGRHRQPAPSRAPTIMRWPSPQSDCSRPN
jgi:transposase InsO family protein